MTAHATAALPVAALPAPPGEPLAGHLRPWAADPLRLFEDGARLGPVFRLRLWRRTVVGYRPEWNRAVLGDLDTFRSRGSLSGLTPYLRGGVVHSDVPQHAARRSVLEPPLRRGALAALADRLAALADSHRPAGPFEALAWSGTLVRRMLDAALFDARMPDPLLARFLAPLDRPIPHPLLPRPRLFRQVDAAIAGALAASAADGPGRNGVHAALASLPDPVDELRVALAAGYDTTAHTLAWALWHLAAAPQWRQPDTLDPLLDEVLRLYPAGWLGSRVTSRDTVAAGVALPAGTLVLYSPYLTHRDPELWPEPGRFRPERFRDDGRPAWGFLPFAAGRRTCLGAHLARLMLRTALVPFCRGGLTRVGGDPRVRAGITLRPRGPLWLDASPRGRTG